MPRAKSEELQGFHTTSQVAELLNLSPYLIRARIDDGMLPPASKRADAGVLLFDDGWLARAREVLTNEKPRRRKRKALASDVPSPAEYFGHEMGESGWLPRWDQVVEYFSILEQYSPRVAVQVEGQSTEGRPYLVVYVADSPHVTDAGLAGNREALSRLWDPREVPQPEIDDAIDRARSVGVILAAQHSNEIGSMLMTMQLAWEMATAVDANTLHVLSETITVLIPSHNPDGADMVAEWYMSSVGTEWEGVDMPWLYHHFTGHDNNRDWFMQTQAETRSYVTMHNREHPQAVFDMHQMRRYGPRFMVPPFIDPLDPNQDPVIQQGFAALGSHIAQRMTAAGKSGVVTHAMFDNYSPSLAYGNYHGSVDLLSEAASAKLATPVTLTDKDLRVLDGIDPRKRAWNQPLVWEAGQWSLRDIVSYNLVAARAMLEHLARNRRQWLADYVELNRRTSARTDKPYAFVIPPGNRDNGAVIEMLDILQRGLVEIHRATGDFKADGVTYPEGTWVVRLDQPAGTFAKTLLEVQRYPEMRVSPDGPLLPPYDISGHTLPIQMGVSAFAVDTPLADIESLQLVKDPVRLDVTFDDDVEDAAAWVIEARTNGSIAALAELHKSEIEIFRVKAANETAGLLPGDILIRRNALSAGRAMALGRQSGVDIRAVKAEDDVEVWQQLPVRVGVYQSWTACIDEGWARWVLEQAGMPYITLRNADIRQGHLMDRVDVLVMPEMSGKDIRDGRKSTTSDGEVYPPEYCGGIGDVGVAALRAFVAAGGTVIAVDRSASMMIEALALPVGNPLEGKSDAEFSCPGSLLQVVIDTSHPIGWGLPRELSVLFMGSRVFSGKTSEVTTIARYPQSNPLLSGWISGERAITGASALVDVIYGAGRVVLFGFRPWFRAQARGTYRTFFNAIHRHGLREATW